MQAAQHALLWTLLLLIPLSAHGQEINARVSVEARQAGPEFQQKYFLIEHRESPRPQTAKGLVLILPGGPGSADFLSFCANVLVLQGMPEDFVAAQLVAPVWTQDENRVVWPSAVFPDARARFTTEVFIRAVIKDVSQRRKIDGRFIFTLGWSSSGHALYSAAASEPAINGSFIAMSRFLPAKFATLEAFRNKALFLYHSPEDRICPFSDSEQAERLLSQHGARVKLFGYKGGHGWTPGSLYCDRIREGLIWLKRAADSPPGH